MEQKPIKQDCCNPQCGGTSRVYLAKVDIRVLQTATAPNKLQFFVTFNCSECGAFQILEKRLFQEDKDILKFFEMQISDKVITKNIFQYRSGRTPASSMFEDCYIVDTSRINL